MRQERITAPSTRNDHDPAGDRKAASTPNVVVAAPILTTLAALRAHDPWVRMDTSGRYDVDIAALRTVNIAPADIRSESAQAVLAAMSAGQEQQLDRIIGDGLGVPFRVEQGRLVLTDHFEPGLRAAVSRWAEDETFRALTLKVWPTLQSRPVIFTDKSPWHRAAGMRKRAMNEWDAVERSDRTDADALRRPGQVLPRPGLHHPENATPVITPPLPQPGTVPRRFHPGMLPGGGGRAG